MYKIKQNNHTFFFTNKDQTLLYLQFQLFIVKVIYRSV